MSIALTTDILLESVGKRVNDIQNKYLGDIVEIIRNSANHAIDYVVLKSNKLLDQEDRFFAIPVSTSIIKISETGQIILLADKEDLHLACGVTSELCPQPNLHLSPLIFELFEYGGPEHARIKNANNI